MSAPERFRTWARKGAMSLIESTFGYYEVWSVDGRGPYGLPIRYTTWDDAVEAFDTGVSEENLSRRGAALDVLRG